MQAQQNQNQLTVIDLFAGCGGLSLGLEQSGFRPLLVSELNDSALDTYMSNRQGQGIEPFTDIKRLTNKRLKKLRREWAENGIEQVDLVCGGPPCQGYSGIGHRRTHKVTRAEIPSNYLYKQMIRVIKAVEPKAFLFENVRGLLSGRWTPDGKKGEIWQEVLESFRKLKGYAVYWSLVHAKDYGVPQNRPRILMVGIRRDFLESIGVKPPAYDGMGPSAIEAGFLPAPRAGLKAPDLEDVFGDLIDPHYCPGGRTDKYPRPAQTKFQREMRTGRNRRLLADNVLLTEHEYSDHSERVREKFQSMIDNGGTIPARFRTKKFAQRLLDKTWGPGGPTITATSLPDDYVHFAQPRSLTVREWARLQTFPDWYEFKGPRTTGGSRRAGIPSKGIWDREVPRYTQIGNAVPVRLARCVGEHLKEMLTRHR